MDLEARKISFVQEFLRLQNEDIINGLEKMLQQRKRELFEQNLKPMNEQQFNEEIDMALKDSENDNVIEVLSLKNRVNKWT